MAKKVVVKLQINDCKDKQKAMKTVSTLCGIESLAVDLKEKKLTVVGDIDPVDVVSKLRKCWQAEIVTVGPAKEPGKKENEKKEDDKKKEEDKKKQKDEQIAELMKLCRGYYPPCNMPPTPCYDKPCYDKPCYDKPCYNKPCYNPPCYYTVCSSEENPNSCTIC